VSTKSIRLLASTATLVAGCALLLPAPAKSDTLPGLLGETALQQAEANAVATMCLNALDANGRQTPGALTVLQVDLHDQCHAIAVANLSAAGAVPAGGTGALSAFQQVSGSQISTPGALATRVVAGQAANISGRLSVLRFGASAALSQGRVASDGSGVGGSGLASVGPQTFYVDGNMLNSNSRGDGYAPSLLPGQSSQTGALTNTSFVSSGPMSRAPYASASDDGTGGSGSAPLGQPANPWGIFVQGSYNSGHHNATANEDPFHFHASSVTAGADYNFGTAVVGASVGYDDYDASFRTQGALYGGGSARVEGTSGSLYGGWFGDNWTVNGIATYGHLTTSLTRLVNYTVTFPVGVDPQGDLPATKDNCVAGLCSVSTNRTLRGSPSGDSVAVGATVGYQYTSDAWNLLPSLSLNYRHAKFDSFAETDPVAPTTDGLPLAFGDQTVQSLRAIVGIDLSRAVSVPFGVVTPLARVEWDHEFKTGARAINVHYVNDPTAGTTCLSCVNLPTDSAPANYGIGGLGLSVALAHRIQAFVYDEMLFGFANYRSNSITLGVRVQL
jgi:uncharacterized protein YhjY with autotransporter beta-barrel domain